MVWQGVPFAIGGGAEVPVEAARVLAYVAASAGEGPVGVGALQVLPLEVPGAGVRVMPGAAVILNRSPGGGQQAYVARNPDEDQVAIPATGSAGGRTDLVAVVIEDPAYPGQPAPADVATGPYVRTKVYPNVGAARTLAQVDPGQSGLALARVTLGASDGTVTTEKIELLGTTNEAPPPPARVGGLTRTLDYAGGSVDLTSAAYVRFPDAAKWTIPVPVWATAVTLEAYVAGMVINDTNKQGGNWTGNVRASLGGRVTGGSVIDLSSAGEKAKDRFVCIAGGDTTIPKELRGTNADLEVQLKRTAFAGGLRVSAEAGLTVIAKATFYELPDATFWTA